MIPKKLKLPIDEFPKNHQVVYRGDFFSLRTVPNNLGHNRLGVAFRSGAFKAATQRNSLRRTIFGSLEKFARQKPASEGTDLLITLNPAILNLTREEIISNINNDIDPIQRIIAPPAR